jgi:hypothetical protein
MNVLRQVNKVKLNQGSLMANGLFNLSLEEDNVIEVSNWFDEETKERLMNLADAEFFHQGKDMITEANNY